MQLYTHSAAPNPLKVRLAIQELELEVEMKEVDLLTGEQRTPQYRQLNPFGKVPVFEDGNIRLRESNAIISYLGREYGGPLWPQDPQTESEMLQWLFFDSAHLAAQTGAFWWNDRVIPTINKPERATNPEVLKYRKEELESSLPILEVELSKKPFIMGAEYTLVDGSLGVSLNSLRGTSFGIETRFPKLLAYIDKIRKRPSWKAAGGEGLYLGK